MGDVWAVKVSTGIDTYWLDRHGGGWASKSDRHVGTRGECATAVSRFVGGPSVAEEVRDIRFVRIKRKPKAVEDLYRVKFSIDFNDGIGVGEYFASTSLSGHGNSAKNMRNAAMLPFDQAQKLAAKVIEAHGERFRSVSIEPVP